MPEQDRHFHFYFSLLYLSAVLVLVMAGCGVSKPAAIGTQPPFQMYETHGNRLPPVESCLDDNPNPAASCI